MFVEVKDIAEAMHVIPVTVRVSRIVLTVTGMVVDQTIATSEEMKSNKEKTASTRLARSLSGLPGRQANVSKVPPGAIKIDPAQIKPGDVVRPDTRGCEWFVATGRTVGYGGAPAIQGRAGNCYHIGTNVVWYCLILAKDQLWRAPCGHVWTIDRWWKPIDESERCDTCVCPTTESPAELIDAGWELVEQ